MTLRLLKSVLAEALIADYVAAVKRFGEERKNWVAHMTFVEAERNFPLVAPQQPNYANRDDFAAALKDYNAALLQRHVPYPAPSAHPSVMAAINSEGEVDFEIVDDLSISDGDVKPS
jgi:hypothetical protein